MNGGHEIDRIVQRLLGASINRSQPLAGGCMHEVHRLELSNGSACVIKVAAGDDGPLLQSELAGLKALAETGGVRTPDVLGLEREGMCTVLVLEALEPAGNSPVNWHGFGESLAALHACEGSGRYGFESDNHIGRTPQCNTWCSDWVEFNVASRLGPQVHRARDNGLLGDTECSWIESLINQLDRYIPRHPRSSLLHGDLWSGNALPMRSGDVAVIDPACSWGDAWSDVGMMELFGGFPRACLDAWEAEQSDRDQSEERKAIAQVYHLLNHLNLFGASYLGQLMSVVERLR
ncbi:MAG: fructosamine kinase family protein [Phycisphaerales bacterium]|nr:fructosamine kinase family protein [Phycisphaerales bacterium]